jgi:hypothetical protein
MFDSIVNRNEYFSNHYLDALLQNDLAGLRERWKAADDAGEANARVAINSGAASFFAARADAAEAASGRSASAIAALHDAVLRALRFTPDRRRLEFMRGGTEVVQVDVATIVETGSGPLLIALDLGLAATVDDVFDAEAAGLLQVPMLIDDKPQPLGTDAVSYLFSCDEPPRFVLLIAGGVLVLADREKWAEGRFLAVDVATALERNDSRAKGELETIAALVSADALVPVDGQSVFDQLVDKSYKHAVGVSKDLRDGIRLSIELLANEVIAQRLARNLNVYSGGVDPRELTRQCLRFLYRMLVLLYAEARPELGVLPSGDADYTAGYSLDRLRELALTQLTTEKARNGTHIHESLQLLFRLVNEGYHDDTMQGTQGEIVFDAPDVTGADDRLVFRALHSELFDEKSTELLDRVSLRNEVLQQVLEHLVLSKQKGKADRGFISYAQLGINQLGAVYEGLMAYTGFFADVAYNEVARHGDPSDGVWLVPVERAHEYPDDVFVLRENPRTGQKERVRHERGSFVFRLSGRDRQRSASYYTPEVLTRCVVKHALAELLDQDGATTSAEDILSLTICEPALGSGAFLNEAISQLGHEYLRRRQAELDDVLSPDRYETELQKVKAHLALNQCYGVDLNATAVELAEVSLWLNCMHPGLEAPWFGNRLRRGNSLVGVRRATYNLADLKARPWLDTAPIDRKLSDGPLPEDEVHHFLLPAHGWAAVADAKEAKELRADRCKGLRAWRQQITKAPTAKDAKRLTALATRVEELWRVAEERLRALDRNLRRNLGVYGTDEPAADRKGARSDWERAFRDPDTPIGRLRMVMDAWIGLWFWPVDTDVALPSWNEWLDGVDGLLDADVATSLGQLDLFADLAALQAREGESKVDRQVRPASEILAARPWLGMAIELAQREGAWHWELEFAPVFARGGFDLQVGNPPWVRPRWLDDLVLAESEPWFGLTEKASEIERRRRRSAALASHSIEAPYLAELASAEGLTTLLGSTVLHGVLTGMQINFYMLFMETVWRHAIHAGVSSLLHPESHLVDPHGGAVRRATYRRLRRHAQFLNELRLFEDVHNMTVFGIHVYGVDRDPAFLQVSQLLHSATLDDSLEHDGSGEVPGIKTPNGEWDLRPHRDRVITIDEDVLGSWAKLFDEPGTPPLEARLLRPVTVADLGALEVLADQPTRLADHGYFWTSGFHEKGAKEDGIIEWRTEVSASWDDVILQGPHFTVASSFSKQPNENCSNNRDYSDWDLEALPEWVIPRTNYQRARDRISFIATQDHWKGVPFTKYWRVVWRRMTSSGSERSLQAALLTPGPAHVNTVHSMALDTNRLTAAVAGLWSSVPLDYLLKVSGRADVQNEFVKWLPLPFDGPAVLPLIFRTLRLNCLTADYAPLWEELYDPAWQDDAWTDASLARPALGHVGPMWTKATPLRFDEHRRAALVEIDALAALILGLTTEQLCAMYRAQFAVLRKYEYNMLFDAQGRQIAKDHQAYGFHQQKGDWELVNQWVEDPGSVELPDRYVAPFTKPDREREMTHAYKEFARRLGQLS